MSDYTKQNQDDVTIEENINPKEVTESLSEKKKKPFLERLGIIEAVNRPIEKESTDNTMNDTFSEQQYQKDAKEENNYDQYKSEKNIEKLPISKIYTNSGLSNLETASVYLLESFIKALPDNLPSDIKRQSIINLVTASQLELSKLIKDGEKRMQVLETYQQEFTREINDLVATNQRIINKLNERIANHKKIIQEKQDLLAQQKADVEFEIQKISNVIRFVESKE